MSLLLFIFLFTSNCAEKINASWKISPIEIDGNGQDWERYPLTYNDQTKVMYGIVHDDESLNILFRFNDPSVARIFSRRGVTLWFNNKNKKDKKLGIHYFDDNFRDIENMPSRRFQQSRNPGQIATPNGTFSFALEDTILNLLVSEMPGWQAAVGKNDGLFDFEFSVPLKQIGVQEYYLDLTGQSKIKIAIEIPGLSEAEIAQLKAQMVSRRDASMMSSGGRKGGMGGGRGGGRGGSNPRMPDTDGQMIWITVPLATIEK